MISISIWNMLPRCALARLLLQLRISTIVELSKFPPVLDKLTQPPTHCIGLVGSCADLLDRKNQPRGNEAMKVLSISYEIDEMYLYIPRNSHLKELNK